MSTDTSLTPETDPAVTEALAYYERWVTGLGRQREAAMLTLVGYIGDDVPDATLSAVTRAVLGRYVADNPAVTS